MPRLTIDYYTDPLCAWSWALEPSLRWLAWVYGEQLAWRVRLGAMISSVASRDPRPAIDCPAQWAPQWFDVARQTGMPLQPSIWHDDPPHESVTPCVAVSAARLQGEPAAAMYLRRLREAAVLGARNITRREVLLALSRGLPGLDADHLADDLDGAAAHHGLRNDLMEVRYLGLTRYPALVVAQPGPAASAPRMLVVGWRPREALAEALHHAEPGLEPRHDATDPGAFVDAHDSLTVAELSLIFSLDREDALAILEQRVNEGELERATDVAAEHGLFRRRAPQRVALVVQPREQDQGQGAA